MTDSRNNGACEPGDLYDGSTESEPLEITVPTTSLNPFEKLSESIEQQPFSSSRNLTKKIDDRHISLNNDKTREEFLFFFFPNVPSKEHSKLSDDSS